MRLTAVIASKSFLTTLPCRLRRRQATRSLLSLRLLGGPLSRLRSERLRRPIIGRGMMRMSGTG